MFFFVIILLTLGRNLKHGVGVVFIFLLLFWSFELFDQYNLAFQYFNIELTCWKLIQKRVVRTAFDICGFIKIESRGKKNKRTCITTFRGIALIN
jgi:hypothetical protein